MDAHFQVNASYVIKLPPPPLPNAVEKENCNRCPSLINASYDNHSKILGISKTGQNHWIHSVSCVINKVLPILSRSI